MKKVIITSVIDIILLLLTLIFGVPILYTLALIVWKSIVIYSLADLRHRYILLLFSISFFVFLLGQELVVYFFDFKEEYRFTDDINNHTYLAILLSLIGIFAGYAIVGHVTFGNRKTKKIDEPVNAIDVEIIRKIAKIGIAVTVIPYYLYSIDQGLFVHNNAYVDYYTSYSSNLPSIVIQLAQIFTIFLFLFLATMPSRKECRIPVLLYLGYGVVSLFTGRRLFFGMIIFFVAAYYIMRQYESKEEVWITKKMIVFVIALMPVTVLLLYSIKYSRYGQSVERKNFGYLLLDFIYQQGTSVNIIKFQKRFSGDDLGVTSLYHTLRFLRTGLLTRHIFNFPTNYYAERGFNTAYNTNCLPDYIYFRINSRAYRKGYGLGGCYIAELFHDGGYPLVLFGNFALGILLCYLFNFSKSTVWKRTIGLTIMGQIFVLPRYGADYFMKPFYNLTALLILLGTYIFTNQYRRMLKSRGNL